MDKIVEENQFLNNFLKQFKGKNQKEILDSLLVIGADQIISNFKFSQNLQDDIVKTSKKIQSYFVQGESVQLKNEIETLRQELIKLNQKFEGKQEKHVSVPIKQEFSPPTKIQFSSQSSNKSESRMQGVKKIPFKEKNQSTIQKLYQEPQENFIKQNQKRFVRSSSLSEVNTSGSKSKKQQQQVTLKVTEVIPDIPKPVKYTPKYHHLNDEQVKSNFEHYKELVNIENDKSLGNRQKSQQRQYSSDNHFQQQKYSQKKQEQNKIHNYPNQNNHEGYQQYNNQQYSNNLNHQAAENVNNFSKGQGQNSFETLNQNQISHSNLPQYQSNQDQNKLNFNIQNQFGIQGQISPKFNDAIANFHTNQVSSRNDQHSFNQNDHNSLNNYNKNNNHEQQSFEQHSLNKNKTENSQRAKNRSNQSLHGRSKGSSNMSPQLKKANQKSMSQNGSRKIYYDPRKMKKGDIFNPINSKKEQLNVQRAQSKIKGDIQERKQTQKQFGRKYDDVEVYVNQPAGFTEQESQLVNNNNSRMNNSYQNNNNNYYNQNFSGSQYNLQSQQQHISSSQNQSQQQQQIYDINEDSAQLEDRPRQINNYSLASANNTFLNKSRSYTATTAATGDIRQSQNLYSQNFYGAKQQNSFKNNYNDMSDYQNRNSQNGSASKQFHQESTGSFAMNENHHHHLRYPEEQVEVSPQKINSLYDPKIASQNQSYTKNQVPHQYQQMQRYYDGDESDIIVHDDGQTQNTFIQDSANRQSMSSRFVGNQINNNNNSNSNNNQQQSQHNQTVNDNMNNRSQFNYQNLNQHLTQHYIRSNNQSINGQHPYMHGSSAYGQNQLVNNERNSNRTENSFQDQSSILQNPFATVVSYQPQRNAFNKSKNNINGSFTQTNPTQNYQDNSGFINTSNNYIQNPFRDHKTYDQNSYLGIEKLSNSHIDNNRQSINEEINNRNHLQGGTRQSQNIYEQKYKELVQKQDKIGNSQQLVYSDQLQQTKSIPNQYQNRNNNNNQTYDAFKFGGNNYGDYSQNNLNSSNNYIIPSRLQNLNSTQRSKLTTERSPDQQNSFSKKSEQNISPDLSNHNIRQLADQKTYYQDPTSQSINKQIQGKTQQRAAPHFKNYELSESADKYQKEFSRNLELTNNNNQYNQYKQHETFTNRQQENMCEYSITSRDPQSPPLKIQASGAGSVESEDFAPFEVNEQVKMVFLDDKLFFKESQQHSQSRSQTTRSEQ